jgi:hypothetical protein
MPKAARKCGDFSRAEFAQSLGDVAIFSFESFLRCYRAPPVAAILLIFTFADPPCRRWRIVADKNKSNYERKAHDRFGDFSEVNASDL